MTALDLVEALGTRLGRSVVLYDTSFRMVSYSSSRGGDVDEARVSIILARQGSARAVEMIRSSGVSRSRGPVRLPRDPARNAPARVAFAVRRRDRLVGYLVYIDDEPDVEPPVWQREALFAANDGLAELLTRHQADRNDEREHLAVLVRDLVCADPAARSAAGEALLAHGHLHPARAYRAVVLILPPRQFRVLAPRDRMLLDDGLAELLRLQPGTSCGAITDDTAVAVLGRAVAPERLATLVERTET
ncbi:MAG: hypothetical protein ACRDXB_21640, partial [Actinomycetes bacterium]